MQTEQSRNFINLLFRTLLAKITPEDILKLSKSTSCTSYVFLMADSIQKVFQDLRIRPRTAGDTGILLFEKVDKIQQATPQTRDFCITVAYFYVRIFQIFAALALTVIDDPGAGEVLAAVQFGAPQGKAPIRGIPGARGAFLAQYGGDGEELEGGALEEGDRQVLKYTQYAPLMDLLEKIPGQRYSFLLGTKLILEVDKRLVRYESDEGTEISANLQFELAGDKLTLKMQQFKISKFPPILDRPAQAQMALIANNMRQRRLTLRKDASYSWVTESDGTPLVESLMKFFTSLVPTLIENAQKGKAATIEGKGDKKVQEVLRGLLKGDAKLDAPIRDLIKRAQAESQTQSDIGVPKGLATGYLIEVLRNLSGKKSVGFCVARALQLIDANALFQIPIRSAVSQVCQPKMVSLPGAVPAMGESLEKVHGLHALEQLFFDQPLTEQASDGKTTVSSTVRVSDASKAQYVEFLQKMAELFGKKGVATKYDNLTSIQGKNPECPETLIKQSLQITDPKSIQSVAKWVGQLFGKQVNHTQLVVRFLRNRLLLIQRRRDPATGAVGDFVDIHPKILQGGIRELNLVATEARNILVKYYSECEGIYQSGLQEVLRAKTTPIKI